MLIFLAGQALHLLLLLAACAAAGTLLRGPGDSLAFRGALGMALWADALFVLASAGLLRPAIVATLAAIVIAAGAVRARKERLGWPAPIAAGVGLLLATEVLLLSAAPAIAFDETLYHLPFVRAFASTGALTFLPDLRFPVFPQFHELLSVPLFFLGGAVAAHLVSFAAAIFTAGLLVAWGRRYGSESGLLAAALFAGSPIVIHLATISYVELTLTLFVVAGFYCLDRARSDPHPWLLLSGFLFGSACSVKYLGIYFAACALLLVVIATRRARSLGLFAAGLIVAALPTYTHIFETTGNPLFPFQPHVFGSNAYEIEPSPPLGWMDRAAGSIRVLWDVTFSRGRVNQQPPFTPFFIALPVIAMVAARRDRRALAICLIGAAYLAAFTFLPQDSRYLVPLIPLLAIVAGGPIIAALQRAAPRAIPIVLLLALSPGLAYAAYRLALQGMPPATEAGRREFVRERVASFRALEHATDGAIYVCGAEQLQGLTSQRLLGDHFGPHSYRRVLDDVTDSERLRRLQTLGVRYLLVSRSQCPSVHGTGMHLVFEDASTKLWDVSR